MNAGADALLLGCVKRKLNGCHRAADLYASPLWARRRAYAEAAGHPWFIFSAKHGLLSPDDEVDWYNCSMRDLTPSDRRAKGEAAAEKLERLLGGLTGRTIEVHAGAIYVDAIRSPIERRNGRLALPMAGRGIGQQLRRYDELLAREPEA